MRHGILVKERFKALKKNELGTDDEIEIDCSHRMGRPKNNQSRPRTTVCRFVGFKDKQNVLRNAKKLKNVGIYIYEDFCDDTMELR